MERVILVYCSTKDMKARLMKEPITALRFQLFGTCHRLRRHVDNESKENVVKTPNTTTDDVDYFN